MLTRLLASRRRVVIAAVVAVLAVSGCVAVMMWSSNPTPYTPAVAPSGVSTLEVPAPQDGDLVVGTATGEVRVAQLAGTRTDRGKVTQRTFTVANPVVVKSAGKPVKLRSGTSKRYTAAASKPGSHVTVTGVELAVTGASEKVTVSVVGNAGGTWQFVIDPT